MQFAWISEISETSVVVIPCCPHCFVWRIGSFNAMFVAFRSFPVDIRSYGVIPFQPIHVPSLQQKASETYIKRTIGITFLICYLFPYDSILVPVGRMMFFSIQSVVCKITVIFVNVKHMTEVCLD